MASILTTLLCLSLPVVLAQQAHFDTTQAHNVPSTANEPWSSKYGAQTDVAFSGLLSFAHAPYAKCLEDPSHQYDIAILGMPFDTTTSYRPGARFGPYAIRAGSRRQFVNWALDMSWNVNTGGLGSVILDCGDVSRDQTAVGIILT